MDFRPRTFRSIRGAVVLAMWFVCSAVASAATIEFGGHEVSTDSLLVKWRPNLSGAARSAAKSEVPRTILRASSVEEFPQIPGVAVLRLQPVPATKDGRASDPAAAVQLLRQQIKEARATGLFAYVEPDYIVRTSALPTDSAFTDGTLWALRNTGQNGGVSGADIKAVPAWDITTGARRVVVAVIDTGIRYTHQDLAANMWRNPGEIPGNGIDDDGNGYVDDVFGINAINNSGNPMDDENHGTHCAGTIGAVANGGGPHVGVAWEVSLMALKFLNATGSGSSSDAIKCINYAVAKGADIMSNSWGGGGYSQALFDSIAAAERRGILFVAAAGNAGANNDTRPAYPASYQIPNIISVAATDRRNTLASFSNYGASTVHVGAPGVAIYSCTAASDSSYASYNGTSMACPHVAGAAALVKAQFPSIGLAELKNRLLATTTPLTSLAGRTITGGLLNAENALRSLPDGVLEVSAVAGSSPLVAGTTADIFITVSDILPVTNATVRARFPSGTPVEMLDNGVAPDRVAGDAIYAGRLAVPTGVTSVPLQVEADAPGKQPARPVFDFAVATPPPNDNFANRTVLPGGTTRTTGSNVLATQETGEPLNPAGLAGGTTVWWSWTAPANATVRIDTNGSDYDTTLAVYTGSSLGTLRLVTSNDDDPSAPDYTSAVSFTAAAGTTYAVQVSGWAGDTGNIVLRYPQPQTTRGEPVITGQPSGTTVEEGTAFALQVVAIDADSYQWYRNNSPVPDATGASYTVARALREHEGVYRVLVSNTAGSTASAEARVIVQPSVQRPPNDSLAARVLLSGASGRVSGSNRDATGEAGELDHAGVSQPLQSVWYEWRAPSDGVLTLTTAGSAFDTTLALYAGTSLGSLRLLAANDDDPAAGVSSRVVSRVAAGTVYVIAVDGYSSASGALTLDYNFASDVFPGNNDRFTDAFAMAAGTVTGSNVRATREAGEPWHLPGRETGGSSVWWKWTAPASGTVVLSTAGSSFDTILAVYDGASLDGLRLLAANDDAAEGVATSAVEFQAEAGATYYLAVDGYARAEGSVRLTLSMPSLPQMSPWEQWLGSYGLDPLTNGSFAADADGDGFSNGTEFAFGASPVSPDASLKQVSISGGLLTVSFLARESGFDYELHHAPALPSGFTRAAGVEPMVSPSREGVPAGWQRMEFSVPISGTGFYRVHAVPH